MALLLQNGDLLLLQGGDSLSLQAVSPTLWTPAEITTALWLDASDSDTITLNSGNVSQWDDKSTNNRHATEAGATAQPGYISAELNGLSVLRFDGSNDKLQTASASLHSGEWCVFSVAKSTKTTGTQMIFAQDADMTSRVAQYIRVDATAPQSIAFNSANAAFSATNSGTITNWNIHSAKRSSSEVVHYINGSAGTPVSTTGTVATGTIPAVIGGFVFVGSASLFWQGDIAEIILAPSALAGTHREKIEGYLAWKWGLEANLPSGHPYEDAPPVIPPVLTSPTGTSTGETTADGTVSTDVSNGSLYWMATETAASPTVEQVQAGVDYGDPNWADVSLLLHMDGADGSTTFTDSSSNALTVTAVGNAQVDTAQSKFGGASLLLDGVDDSLSCLADAGLQFGAGEFTVECWINPDSITGFRKICGIWFDISGSGFSWKLSILDGELRINYSTNGSNSSAFATTGSGLATGAWQHVAMTRSGTTVAFWLDGVNVGSTTISATFFNVASSKLFEIGIDSAGGNINEFDGWIDELRITKGIARYTAAFTPPTAPFADEAQVIAVDSGSQAVSVTGSQTVNIAGLSLATDYYAHFQHRDAANVDSLVVSSAAFQTEAAASGPVISSQPANTTVDENTTASFSVTATGAGTLSYQWQVDTGAGFADIVGETASTLSFTALEGDTGNLYRVVVTDDDGSLNSSSATLTVTALFPTITVQPTGQGGLDGDIVTFEVTATASAGSLTYQWYNATDDSAIPGETASTLDITASAGTDGSTYYVIVTDSNGSIQSNTVALTLLLPITIDTQPEPQAVIAGGTATFTVAASGGNDTLTYQWYELTAGLLSGETSATLDFAAADGDNGNEYYCIVSDGDQTEQSLSALLTVTAALTITTQPQAVAANAGDLAMFSVAVTGTDPIQYQWFGPQGVLPGQNGPTLVINAHPAIAGNFYCFITDATGQAATSNNAALTVTVQDPVILIQPTSQSVAPSNVATFEVSAKGFGGLTYTWHADGSPLDATGYKLAVFDGVSGTEFYCVVADDYGNSVQSSTVTLTVNRVSVDNQTDPRTPTELPPSTRPRYTVTDWAGMVRAADGPQPQYEPDYEFSGRTFKRRIT